MQKKILYIDMDGVVADFDKEIKKYAPDIDTSDYETSSEKVYAICKKNPVIFYDLDPMPHAVEAVKSLWNHFDIYFLSTPMWQVSESYSNKREWIEKHFGELAEKRLILTHRKDLCIGDYLVDDRLRNGVDQFKGEHIHFGTEQFPNWFIVHAYLWANK